MIDDNDTGVSAVVGVRQVVVVIHHRNATQGQGLGAPLALGQRSCNPVGAVGGWYCIGDFPF